MVARILRRTLVTLYIYIYKNLDESTTVCSLRWLRSLALNFICICYSTGRSDIRDIFHEFVGIAAVKSHEVKPSVISPLYRKRVEYIPEFHDCPCSNIFHGTQRGRYITFFMLVGDISRRQVIFHIGR